jgi:alpha-tubulin suppressor-like RCC1 family protein
MLRITRVLRPFRSFHYSHRSLGKLTEHKYDDAQLMSKRLTEEPYYAKREPQDEPEEQNSSPEELQRFQTIEIIKGLIAGSLTIGGLLGGYILYVNWPELKAWYNDDDSIDVPEPKKKQFELPVITNKNDSKVPGLYLCGDNSSYIVSMDEKVNEVRYMMRHDWFDGKLLKLVVLGENSALAIDTKGDLIQWGLGFNGGSVPEYTVRGERLVDAKISNGVVYAMTEGKDILVVPESTNDHLGSFKRNWLFQEVPKPYVKLPTSFEKGEKIDSYDTGKEHLVLLTSRGRAFTCSTGLKPLQKSFGQFGIPQFSHLNKPPFPNELHEISLLNQMVSYSKEKIDHVEQRRIKQVQCGSYHTLAVDTHGGLYTFGQNTYGQLGHPINYTSEHISYPKKVEALQKFVKKTMIPEVLSVHTSGDTNFVKFKPVHLYQLINGGRLQDEDPKIVGFGKNLKGQLGNGLFIHSQAEPVELRELAKFKDFDERTGEMKQIDIAEWSVGKDHTMIKLVNGDVLYWGANDDGQLGNGKRNRIPKPSSPPRLIEPWYKTEDYKDLTFVNRLQLSGGQHVVAGVRASGIFYSK